MQLTVKEQVWMKRDKKPVFHPTNGREAKTATLFPCQLLCVFAHVISTVRLPRIMYSVGDNEQSSLLPLA